jgi:hypothetical protein
MVVLKKDDRTHEQQKGDFYSGASEYKPDARIPIMVIAYLGPKFKFPKILHRAVMTAISCAISLLITRPISE